MELATLKMERLHVGTHQSVSQSIYTDTVELVVGAANVNPLGSFGQDSKPVITTLPVWSAGSVRQSHPTTTPATTAVTTTPFFQPGTQGTTTRAIYTQSQLPRVLPSVHLDRVSHYGILNQTDVSRMSSIIQSQLGEQAISVTTSCLI